ncbi:hypothetical protein ASPWEDRAFT_109794 [Aspergillus wentii DTO 134E9]|uniref:Uncharacterized protein n=1 Tax=Aspergillus wentii DTO 134E9 TaxID=1073089 RepID=A0A1L9RKW9_ASPWE|nr:uncharacterized protein ASPWEDRAFT_109794 [Aspergillus wentii DTO 134E9]OJJ35487.1 hypothetical protein ASPWEDRAFT_109794 [Aspergillus wentii DTO 134E9]
MPAVESPDDYLQYSSDEQPRLKSHKALPRRREIDPQIEVIRIFHSIQDEHHPANHPSAANGPALPLTPPGAAQEDATGDLETPKFGSYKSNNPSVGAVTPQHTRPPTPEMTPPQQPQMVSLDRPFLNQFGQSFSSSRAESFQTALEMISSDGDADTPGRSPSSVFQPTRQNSHSRRTRSLRKSEYPLKLSYNRDELQYDASKPDYDREWATLPKAHYQPGESAIASAHKRKPSRDPSERSRGKVDMDAHQQEVFLSREGSLRRRTKDVHNLMPGLSIEQFREQIGWPNAERHIEPTERPESRRLSSMSTTSTIDAVIVDSPRSSKRTLRHTEKRVSLRSTSSPIPKSERTSLVSDTDSQRRLVHKAARITEQDRRSVMSDASFAESTATGGTHSHVEMVPVVVIPERRSSLKSSASNSRSHSTARSQRSSRRATNASSSRNSSMDRQNRHADSDSIRHEADSRGRGFGGPVIPPRSSSLSAPTSRNNSRAPSLTSESLHNHTLAMDVETQKREPEKPMPEPRINLPARDPPKKSREARNVQSILIGVEDMANLRSSSLPFTPCSISSSSPGPIEINEAITVSFFPHNNKSLLLIDQQLQPDPRAAQAQQPEYRNDVNKQQPPKVLSPVSPLNPRSPPEPPVCTVVPPTPENASEPPRESPDDQEQNGWFRRFGSIRRAWNRPRPESSNSIRRTFSTTTAKNRKAGKDLDSRLHPFWRPRRFWNDSPDCEEGPPHGQENEPSAGNQETPYVISNSLGMPQQRVVFDGPSLGRQSPETARPRESMTVHSNISRSNLVASRVFSPDFFHSASPLHQNRYQSLSRWGLRFRFVKMRNLRKRMRRTIQKRREGKQEARRQKLKQSIVVMGSGTLNRSTMQTLG